MDINVSLGELRDAVESVSTIQHLGNILPVHVGVILTTEPGRLVISAARNKFDRRVVSTWIHAPGAEGGQVADVNLRSLRAALRSLPKKDDTVTIADAEYGLSLTTWGGASAFVDGAITHVVSSKPDLPVGVTVERKEFARALKRIAATVSDDEDLRVLCLARLTVHDDGSAVLEATDRFRLSSVPVKVNADALAGRYQFHVRAVAGVLKHTDGPVYLAVRGDREVLTTGNVMVDSEESSPTPTLNRLFDQVHQPATVVHVHRKALLGNLNAASRALAALNETRHGVVVTIGTDSLSVVVDGERFEAPTMPAVVDVEDGSDGIDVLHVNPDVFADCVKAVDGDVVTLRFTQSQRPIGIFGEDGARALAMPLREQQPTRHRAAKPYIEFSVNIDDAVKAIETVRVAGKYSNRRHLATSLRIEVLNEFVSFATFDYEVARTVRLGTSTEGLVVSLVDYVEAEKVFKALRTTLGRRVDVTVAVSEDIVLVSAGGFTVPLGPHAIRPDEALLMPVVEEASFVEQAGDLVERHGHEHPDLPMALAPMSGSVAVAYDDHRVSFDDGWFRVVARRDV